MVIFQTSTAQTPRSRAHSQPTPVRINFINFIDKFEQKCILIFPFKLLHIIMVTLTQINALPQTQPITLRVRTILNLNRIPIYLKLIKL